MTQATERPILQVSISYSHGAFNFTAEDKIFGGVRDAEPRLLELGKLGVWLSDNNAWIEFESTAIDAPEDDDKEPWKKPNTAGERLCLTRLFARDILYVMTVYDERPHAED